MVALTAAPAASGTPERLAIHELRPHDFGKLVDLVSSGRVTYVCMAAGHLRRAGLAQGIDWSQGTVLATDAEGRVAAFALLEHGRDTNTAQVTLGVDPVWTRACAALPVLEAVVALARKNGFERLETEVSRQTSFELFRSAGLKTLSSMSMGGVTDVALALA